MDINKTSEYNKEDVFYCKRCLSLDIRSMCDMDYCEDCGSTDIVTGDIFVWEKLCLKKYGRPSWDKKKKGEI